jgi:hypothetical protein
VLTPAGSFLRAVPRAVAEALIDAKHAEPVLRPHGRTREVKLVVTAENSCERLGEPTPPTGPTAVRFTRWEYLEASGTRIIQHHPRCFNFHDHKK